MQIHVRVEDNGDEHTFVSQVPVFISNRGVVSQERAGVELPLPPAPCAQMPGLQMEEVCYSWCASRGGAGSGGAMDRDAKVDTLMPC